MAFPWQHPSRNLGALIFDGSDGSTTTVLRVDQFVPGQGWMGPYSMEPVDYPDWGKGSGDSQMYFAVRDLLDFHSRAHNFPEVDFTAKEWGSNRKKKDLYFGFPSMEAVHTWMAPEYLARLKKAGFKVRKVPAKRVWLSKSGQQVIFEPAVSMQEE